jgi:hypothetical protein
MPRMESTAITRFTWISPEAGNRPGMSSPKADRRIAKAF